MTFTEFQNQLYFDIDASTAEYLTALKEIYTEASDKAVQLIKDYYSDYDTQHITSQSLYYWGVVSGRYLDLKWKIEQVFDQACDEAKQIITDCLKMILHNAYYRTIYAQMWLDEYRDRLEEELRLPTELESIITNGDKHSKNFYNNAQGRTRNTYGEIQNWVSPYGSVSDVFEKNRTRQKNLILTAITTYLLGGRREKSLSTRVSTLIGRVKKNSLTGELALSTRQLKTEGIRTMSAGSLAAGCNLYGIDSGKAEKVYSAILDTKARSQSIEMNGQRVSLNGLFVYPDGLTALYPGMTGNPAWDANDRCLAVVLPTALNPDEVTTGKNPLTKLEEPFSWEYYEEWLTEVTT